MFYFFYCSIFPYSICKFHSNLNILLFSNWNKFQTHFPMRFDRFVFAKESLDLLFWSFWKYFCTWNNPSRFLIFCFGIFREYFCTWNNRSYGGRRTCKRRWRVWSQLTAGLQFWTQISRVQFTPHEPVCDTNGRHNQVIFYSCIKITTTWIQISHQNWDGFFSNARY